MKIRDSFKAFFSGRHGVDNLSRVMLWASIILYLLGALTGIALIAQLSMVLILLALFRALSRNTAKRASENQQYLAKVNGLRTKISQAQVRFSNRKQFKYMRCPGCRAWIRLPRNAGAMSVKCRSCNHEFQQKT